MVLIDVDKVTITRPERDLFRDVSITIHETDRVGIVGINGTGKSTLLRVISDEAETESGEVRRGKGVRISFLDQQASLPPGTVRNAVGESWEADSVIDRLGMTPFLDVDVSELSGGEAKRVALAKALLAESDLLILDEPTNHLDMDAIAWLEDRLAQHRRGLLLVTHDRHLLDRVATRVLELDRGGAYNHTGGYQGYLDGKAAREEHAATVDTKRRNLARTELAWLRRGAPARTSKSKSRIERAEKLIDTKAQAAARSGDMNLHMGTPRLGKTVVELEQVTYSHPGTVEPQLKDVTLRLDPHERLGVVGLNGAGKSTLLGLIAGRLQADSGERVEGTTVKLAEFHQRGPHIDLDQRVIQTVGNGGEPSWRDKVMLERFWFDSDVQHSPVRLLSGGERRRLQLVLTLLESPNVLLLDEPTNDLDLDTLRTLEEFLDDWPGALIVVSHDRAFLERTVEDVVIVENGHVGRVPGGYEAWEQARRDNQSGTLAVAKAATAQSAKDTAAKKIVVTVRSVPSIRHDLKQNDKALTKAEKARDRLHVQMETTTNHAELAEIGKGIQQASTDVEVAEERWLELNEELEDRLIQ